MTQHATAVAPSNIALIKYWGKKNETENIPCNDSISFNLSAAQTTTTVTFSDEFREHSVLFNQRPATEKEAAKMIRHVQRFLDLTNHPNRFCHIHTENSFPAQAGIASSASGFAALTLATASALKLTLSERELSQMARLGSGSACRSIPDGFVQWHAGEDHETSFAESILSAESWPLHDVIAIVDTGKKSISSSDGHHLAPTSELFSARLAALQTRVPQMIQAIQQRDFEKMGTLLEQEALSMHAVMMTSTPSLLYFHPHTLTVMRAVTEMRAQGLAAYFTLDAGPNVHVICEEANAKKVEAWLQNVPGVLSTLNNAVTRGTHLV